MERGPLTGHFHISQKPNFSGSPVKEPSLKVASMESLAERYPTTRVLLHSSVKVPGIRALHPHISGSFRLERGPHGERCPYLETSLTYLPGSPVKEAPSTEPLQEERYIPRAPFIHLSKSPVNEPFSSFPKRGPHEKRCPSSEYFLHIIRGPQQGSPPSRFP
jgi:hypothetical protein